MEISYQPGACPRPAGGCVVTIGAYDGVHRGHRQLLDRVKRVAGELGAASAVVTFDEHPAAVVRPASAPKLLTSLEDKLELLAEAGVDHVVVVHFDEARARESAEDFVQHVLVDCLDARAVVVGHDFHFGRERAGDVALLQRMGGQLGFDVTGIRLTSDDTGASGGEIISSTRIRHLVAQGDVGGAAKLLGRWHQLRGLVAHGDKRGRELGFPTANLEVPDQLLLPADGVYAGWYLRPDGTRHQTAISVGRRPTFYETAPFSLVEAHLLDFQGDLYDEIGTVQFVRQLRGQVRFTSVELLIEQMVNDVNDTRATLARSRTVAL
jgi:riboflavin kinase/FMN adenylyltransferase